MQLWMHFVDVTTMAQRKEQMLTMNKKHIDMAMAINEKLSAAIDNIDPVGMKPAEISSLFKVAADLERKARIDNEAQDAMQREIFVDPEQKKQKKTVKTEELGEIAQILMNAGVLKVTKTTTTEVKVDNAIDVEATVDE
jgi:tRNA splicing endonuclease